MPKTRLTGFSRLLLFLLLATPLVYFGASYYNGEDPIANVKGWLGMDEENTAPYNESPDQRTSQEPPPATPPDSQPATFENVQDLRAENDRLRRELAIKTEELARCRSANVE